MPGWLFIPFAAMLGFFWLMVRRANEFFAVRWDGKELTHRRGKLPPALYQELRGIFRDAKPPAVELRCVLEDRRPVWAPCALKDEAVLQRLRNVLHPYATAKLRGGRRPRGR